MDGDAQGVPAGWRPVENGHTVGLHGTEGGIILHDEEHGAGARITLERPEEFGSYTVTCGVYGLFMHTAYAADEAEGQRKYDAMREGLVEIMSLPDSDEATTRVSGFVAAF